MNTQNLNKELLDKTIMFYLSLKRPKIGTCNCQLYQRDNGFVKGSRSPCILGKEMTPYFVKLHIHSIISKALKYLL